MAGIDKKADNENEAPESFVNSSVRDLIANAGSVLGDFEESTSASTDLSSGAPTVAAQEESETGLMGSSVEVTADASVLDAAASETPGESARGKKRSRKKSEKEIIDNVNWNQGSSGLEIIESHHEESNASSEEEATLNKFEELARRVAATVSKREQGDELPENEMGMELPETESGEETLEASDESTEGISEEMSIETMAAEGSQETEASLEESQMTMDMLSEDALSSELENGENVEEEEQEDEGPKEFIEADQLMSVIESLLFSTDKPVSLATIKQIFKGSNIRTKDITRALDMLASEYAAPNRGVTLEEINGGYQLRTKSDNSEFLRRLAKVRPFKLSGPSLEVMSIVAYKQPITKHEIDEIRGVESGHLLRALMERGLVCFNGKSDLPGKPMSYGSTRKFLETFGLRNLRELPTMSEIEELLPEGIGETEEKETLSDITDSMSQEIASTYSEGEDELLKINEQLQAIDTTSEFFEQEKQRERDRKDRERAQDIRERLVLGDQVEEKDRRWLERYDAKLAAPPMEASAAEAGADSQDENLAEVGEKLQALSAESEEMAQAAAMAENLEESESEMTDLDELSDEDLIGNESWDEELESENDV